MDESKTDKMRLLRWQNKETGLWLCAHPTLNVISQGRTSDEAYSAFMHALAMTVMLVVDAEGRAALRLAPDDVAARWAAKAALFTSQAAATNQEGKE